MPVGDDSTLPLHPPASSPADSFGSTERWDLPIGPGERVGNYQIVGLLGTGGMGAVFEAVQDRPRRTVALKVMRLGLQSRTAQARFIKEADFLANVSHPAIAQVYEAGTHSSESGDLVFYAMELIGGGQTLTQYAVEEKLGIREKLEIFAKCCLGVEHAHQQKIIHRDLKPANVMVDALGNPKIIDFGVARFSAHTHATMHLLTRKGDLVGTLQYMSPEQCNADPDTLDARSDVYALGLILYELLTGRLPYELDGKDLPSAVSVIRNVKPPELGRIDSRLSGDINAVVMKALQKDRDLRYASAAEFAVDVQRLLDGKPPFALRADLGIKAKLWWRGVLTKRTGLVVTAIAVAALLVVQLAAVPLLNDSLVTAWLESKFAHIPIPAPATPRFSRVAAIEFRESKDEQRALAQTLGLEGWEPDPPFTRRALQGAILKRIATARPRVLAFDIEFEGDSTQHPEFDQSLADGIAALQAAGTTVVFGCGTFNFNKLRDDAPKLIRPLMPDAAIGAARAIIGPLEMVKVVAAYKHGETDTQPCLSLLAAVNFESPPHGLSFNIEELGSRIVVGRQYSDGENISRKQESLRLTSVVFDRQKFNPPDPKSQTATNPEPAPESEPQGLRIVTALYLPEETVLRSVTMTPTDIAEASVDELRKRIEGKVVIFGQRMARENPKWPGQRMDEHLVSDGRILWGPHMHMLATDQILTDSMPRFLSWWEAWGVAIVGTACGGVLAWWARPRWQMAAGLTGLAALLVLGSIVVYRTTGYLANPVVPTLASVLSGVLIWSIVAQRRRSRPLEALL